ncbi:MAG TPA: zf-TFIIB domain-containing protein [Pyrinomonadaceae bacterium]
MLDGERCIRCQKKYKFEELTLGPDGFGICEPCAAKINPANEEKRRCPVDGQEMTKRLVGNAVLLDKCLACGGVWFDGDELRIVNDLIKTQVFNEGMMLAWFLT